MGQYHKISCPTCRTSLETDEAIEYCPVCDVYIADKLHMQGGGTGITTASSQGDGMKQWGT